MDCYIIASTSEGGWGFNILDKEGRIDQGGGEEGKEEEPVTLDSYLVNKITES